MLPGADQPGVAGPPDDQAVLVPQRRSTPGARPRWGDDGVAAGKRIEVGADQRHGLVQVAGVNHRLAAAGLRGRELDVHPESAQQRDDRLTGVREQSVVDAA